MRAPLYLTLAALGILALASFAVAADSPKPLRSIDPTATELEAVASVQRRAAELSHELELVQARAKAIGEEARVTHHLASGELLAWDEVGKRWDVYAAPSPVPAPSPVVTGASTVITPGTESYPTPSPSPAGP